MTTVPSIEEQLKQEILSQYRSVRAFTQAIGLPYSTVDNIFKRGIGGTAVTTVAKVFRALGLELDSISQRTLRPQEPAVRPLPDETYAQQSRLLDNYRSMNEQGRETLVRLSDDMTAGGRYTTGNTIAFYAVARGRKPASTVKGRRFDPQKVDGMDGEDF